MKKSIVIIFCILSLFFQTNAQSKIGINYNLSYSHLQAVNLEKNNKPFFSSEKIKTRPFLGGHVGMAFLQEINERIDFESQFNIGFNGMAYSSKTWVDSVNQKTTGNYSLFFIQVPLHVLIKFPESNYSASKFVGFGPSFYYNVFGYSRKKTATIDVQKNRLKFSEDAEKFRYGVDVFVGYEGSESNSLKAGFYFDVSGMTSTPITSFSVHQFYVQYCAYFH